MPIFIFFSRHIYHHYMVLGFLIFYYLINLFFYLLFKVSLSSLLLLRKGHCRLMSNESFIWTNSKFCYVFSCGWFPCIISFKSSFEMCLHIQIKCSWLCNRIWRIVNTRNLRSTRKMMEILSKCLELLSRLSLSTLNLLDALIFCNYLHLSLESSVLIS